MGSSKVVWICYTLVLVARRVVSGLSGTEKLCRWSRHADVLLPISKYATDSCTDCYHHIMSISALNQPLNESYLNRSISFADLLKDEEVLRSLGSQNQQTWINCCQSAINCCNNSATELPAGTDECPLTWDGLLCWGPTLPNTTSDQPCPAPFAKCPNIAAKAYKECAADGRWFRHRYSNGTLMLREYTDYGACTTRIGPETPVMLSIIAYSLSLITLVPALLIFQFISSLHCFRVILHKNLIISLILHCSSEIAFMCAFLVPALNDEVIIKNNGEFCRFLRAASIYLTVSNYMWLLCEGLLLHRQLANAFAPESTKFIFFAIGWGLPCLPLIVLLTYRLLLDDDNCWAYPSDIDLVWKIPCLLSLLMNCLFFVYILTVVVRTLSRQTSDNVVQFRKAVRAGLVLVPLFGLHSVIMMYRPTNVCTLAEEYYSYMLRLVEGLQGFIVAVTYCYVNSEVRAALRRTWQIVMVQQQLSQGQVNYTSAMSTQTVL